MTLGIVERGLNAAERWLMLPQDAQETVVAVLARMISAGVVITDAEGERP